MNKFSKPELTSLIVIFLILIGISVPNFALSIKRSRDHVRKDDLGGLTTGLEQYYLDNHGYPLSTEDGKMLACNGSCTWGKDDLVDLALGTGRVYMRLPADPRTGQGYSYLYFSDGSKYQIFASLELSDDAEYDIKIASRNLMCGDKICSIGRSLNCPIDRSIKQYDDELQAESIRRARGGK